MKFLLQVSIILIAFTLICGCKRREAEPVATIAALPLILKAHEEAKPKEGAADSPKVIRIEIGPSDIAKEEDEEEAPASKPIQKITLPPDTYEETELTERLREKMAEAYGKDEAIPDVKIYTSEMKYDDFVKYYKDLGYKVHTVAVPATEIIEPVLEQRPEMAGKINLSNYENVVIHQVMVTEAGISAADKYIDPDTFEVVEKTFVTKTNK